MANMKKTFLILFILAFSLFANQAHAQTSCSMVTEGNYHACCVNSDANAQACNNFCNSSDYFECPQSTVNASGSGSSGGSTAASVSCSTVAVDNYNACCVNSAGNDYACEAYCASNGGTDFLCPAPKNLPGQLSGGSQSTDPFSPSNYATSSVPNAVPVSNSAALKSCSAIRFVSLLDIVIWLKCIIVAAFLPLIFAAAFLYFLWGVFKFMQASDSKDKGQAKNRILMGLIGLFVMVSVWGIIKIVTNTLGIQAGVPMLQTDYLNPANANQKKGG